MYKYIVYPGYVNSEDGLHFISANQLIELYNVDPKECIIYNDMLKKVFNIKNLISLRSRYDGDYYV